MSFNIFISYRRSDSEGFAGRLYDRLELIYPAERLFIDVDSIAIGDDFVERMTEKVAEADVVLALIGDKWLTAKDQDGRRRIDDARDPVRIELETALARGKIVIPVIVARADMPREHELPEALAALARRNGERLSHESFAADVRRIATAAEKAVGNVEARRQASRTAAEEAERKVQEVARLLALSPAADSPASLPPPSGEGLLPEKRPAPPPATAAPAPGLPFRRGLPAKAKPRGRPARRLGWALGIGLVGALLIVSPFILPDPPARSGAETLPSSPGQTEEAHDAEPPAVVAEGGPQTPQDGDGELSEATTAYTDAVASRLVGTRYYPEEARGQEAGGTVYVRFVVNQDGDVSDVGVERSSGWEVLDAVAVETVKRAAPFPPIPGGKARHAFTVPFTYGHKMTADTP